MLSFSKLPNQIIDAGSKKINVFEGSAVNIDLNTVESFGDEWTKFNHFDNTEIETAGGQYFDIINNEIINSESIVLDVGCGTGRWSKYIAPKVKFVEAIDPSEAVYSAAKLLQNSDNVRISKTSVDNIPFEDNSFDLVFSLGVLHHIPDTADAMKKCVQKVKKNGWFLVYLYYSLDNRGLLYRALFNLSTVFRKIISNLPSVIKLVVCDIIAIFIYMPFIIIARSFKKLGINFYKKIPLSYYCDKSFNIIRNDALDRFGTPLEQRFSKEQITKMMSEAGLSNIKFSDGEPYWHAVGQKL